MRIRVFGLAQDSIVDGPGLRTAVFVQGCSHHCPGCHNPGSHDPNAGQEMDTEDILAKMRHDPLCGGLTLSGGEPFEQAAACLPKGGTLRLLYAEDAAGQLRVGWQMSEGGAA